MPPLTGVVVIVFVVENCSFLPGCAAQVVTVKLLPALADSAVQLVTSVGPVVALLHVVLVQLLDALAPALTQAATGTFVVTMGAGQVVVVQPLPDVGPEAVQLATGTLVALLLPQVVAV